MERLKTLIAGDDLIVAPVALNPIKARLAEEAGFKAVYLSGGSLGWLKCVTEANLKLPELADVAVDMRAACDLPVILDGGAGWGDPVHMHRTIAPSRWPRPPVSTPSRSRTRCCRAGCTTISESSIRCRPNSSWPASGRRLRRAPTLIC